LIALNGRSESTVHKGGIALSTKASTLPLAVPERASPGSCIPGHGGIPHNWYGHLMCGDYLLHVPYTLTGSVRAHAWLLAAILAAVVAARLGWALLRRRAWRQAATRAVWLEIVPPVSATPIATHALWNLLATVLPAPHRWSRYPHRLVWEVHATPAGMRCGLWVPPWINPTAVTRALHRAWPGVRAERTTPPLIAADQPAYGLALHATTPDWLPLIDHADPASTSQFETSPEADRIRAAYDGLAAAGRTGAGLLQVRVIRAPRHRVAVLRRAAIDPRRGRRPRGTLRLLLLVLLGLRAAIGGVLDFLTPSRTGRTATGMDPMLAEQSRHSRARHAAGPHLLVAVRAFAIGPTTAAARAAAADITAGYSLLAAHWRPRRLWRPASTAARRWTSEKVMHLATTAEVAALAGLPSQPSTYGLPAAPSRRLAPTRDIFTVAPTVWSAP
jgi:hypothetical protein